MITHLSYTVAGIALLLFSLRHLTQSLDREIVRYLGTGLQQLTKSALRTLLVGLFATLAMQASSVTVITTMGFLSRGLLTLDRAILVMLGAAVGSTLKGWYAAQFPLVAGPALLLLGVLGLVTAKDPRKRRLFEVVVSVGITFLGLLLVETGLAAIVQTSLATHMLEIHVDGGIWSILRTVVFGFALSVLLQSGSSVLLLVLHFASQGLISIPAGLGLLLGANIGTTTTPLLASLGHENADAKRLALGYSFVKVAAAALVLGFFRMHSALLEDVAEIFGLQKQPSAMIAAFNTWFNVMNALTWWFLLPMLLKIVAWLVPQKEAVVGTSPFTQRIQKLLGSLPGRAVSEGVSKVQQVIRDLHWVSDSVFHIVDERGTGAQYFELIEESAQKCDRAVDVLNTVRDVAWRYLQTVEHASESRKKVLSLVYLTADLKNIAAILSSCVQTLVSDGIVNIPHSQATVERFRVIRERLNRSWEELYLLEEYSKSPKDLNPSVYGKTESDAYFFEISIRLGAVQRLMDRNSLAEQQVSRESPGELSHSIGHRQPPELSSVPDA